ncbi:MAG: VCBS repeat-containing protein [Bacteroidetes bacterium]|nr:VCBS repeat-containing protein [Bacteroidota bacterium]
MRLSCPEDNYLRYSIEDFFNNKKETLKKLKEDEAFCSLEKRGAIKIDRSEIEGNDQIYHFLVIMPRFREIRDKYKNNSETRGNNYLRIRLKGNGNNVLGIGTKVTLRYADEMQYQEFHLSRGFESSMEPILHFGLADVSTVDELHVLWPDGKTETLNNVKAGMIITVEQKNAAEPTQQIQTNESLFTETDGLGADFIHRENEYNDFDKEVLLPHKMSQFGPGLAVGDVDNNGAEDFYIGGASGQSGALYLQDVDGRFAIADGPWSKEKQLEDIGAAFFDADGDNDLDLYVVSGGNEFKDGSFFYKDRLYINQGDGSFKRDIKALPIKVLSSGSCVVPGDYDGDGDLDLFVGGRLTPTKYPFAPRSFILNNEGGKFTDVTEDIAPGLLEPGLVTSAVWSDFDNDQDLDLIVVGEWMPIGIYQNRLVE